MTYEREVWQTTVSVDCSTEAALFYQKYCPKKQVLNIGTSLTIQQSLDFGALKEAIYQAYARCESMRLRFTQDEDGKVYQYIADREVRDIAFF